MSGAEKWWKTVFVPSLLFSRRIELTYKQWHKKGVKFTATTNKLHSIFMRTVTSNQSTMKQQWLTVVCHERIWLALKRFLGPWITWIQCIHSQKESYRSNRNGNEWKHRIFSNRTTFTFQACHTYFWIIPFHDRRLIESDASSTRALSAFHVMKYYSYWLWLMEFNNGCIILSEFLIFPRLAPWNLVHLRGEMHDLN